MIEGKIALVTGASRGIGQAIAHYLAEKGAIVIGTATTTEGAERITHGLQEIGKKGKGFVLNVCDGQQVTHCVQQIEEEFGTIGILINNAGITHDNLFLRMKFEQWDTVIDTNLNSVYRMTKACIRAMIKARHGRVINITSVVGVTGNAGQVNYSAAKAGIIGFTKALAQEIAGYGVTVNAIAPGFIDTDMTRTLTEQQQDMIIQQVPMRRMGQPIEIAQAVGFLASDESNYITGQTLHINGGMFMGF